MAGGNYTEKMWEISCCSPYYIIAFSDENPAGYYSYNGYEPSLPCPKGFYQDNPKSKNCTACTDSQTTLHTNSTSVSDCITGKNIIYNWFDKSIWL